MFSIFKREIKAYFNSWSGYLVIGLFLLLNGLVNWVFKDTSILDRGYASMDVFFEFSPFLLVLLISVITMRSLAGEKSEGTLEWLQTRPIHSIDLVLGKFFGGLAIFILALLPTLVYVYSIHALALPAGNVDMGSITGSYIGLILFAGGFVAIGLFASALSNQVIPAFLLGTVLGFCFYLGFEFFSDLLQQYAWGETVRQFGMAYHFDVLARGVLDSRAIIYLLSLIVLFLFLANVVLLKSRLGNRQRRPLLFQVLTISIGLLAINYASAQWFKRLDLSQDKRYSLSPITKETLKELPDGLHITVLLEGNLPPGFQRLRNSVRDLLTDLNSQNRGRINFSFLNPMQGDQEQNTSYLAALAERQITPVNLSVNDADGSLRQQLIFPFAILSDGTQEQVIHLLQPLSDDSPENTINHSIETLEYAFVSAIRKTIGNVRKPIIGFSEGHGELNDIELQDAIYTLSLNNQAGRIDLNVIDFEGLDKVDVLVLAKPTQAFSEAAKFKLDYFLQRGGNLIVSLDQLDGSLDSLRGAEDATQLLLARNLNLDDFLFNYGLRFNYDVIADLQCMQIPLQTGSSGSVGAGGRQQFQWVSWPFHPLIVPDSAHPLVKNMGNLMTEYIGSLDTITVPGVRKSVLLHSSPYAATFESPSAISLAMVQQIPSPDELYSDPRVVAALLEGSFPSAFQNRIPPEGLSDYTLKLPEESKPARLFAISDGDVFKNQQNPGDGSVYPLGWDRFTQQQYSNKTLLLNLIDYMTDDPEVISLRSKEVRLRLLDRLRIAEQKLVWQLSNVALPIIFLFLVGSVHIYLRRKKYSIPHKQILGH